MAALLILVAQRFDVGLELLVVQLAAAQRNQSGRELARDYNRTALELLRSVCQKTTADERPGFWKKYVEADPVLNAVKAGSSVPLKFSLGGDKGLKVLAPDSPASGTLDCDTMEPADDLQPAASAGKSELMYDPKSGTYTYVWKTEKAWAGKCGTLQVMLNDGTTPYSASFQFTK